MVDDQVNPNNFFNTNIFPPSSHSAEKIKEDEALIDSAQAKLDAALALQLNKTKAEAVGKKQDISRRASALTNQLESKLSQDTAALNAVKASRTYPYLLASHTYCINLELLNLVCDCPALHLNVKKYICIQTKNLALSLLYHFFANPISHPS